MNNRNGGAGPRQFYIFTIINLCVPAGVVIYSVLYYRHSFLFAPVVVLAVAVLVAFLSSLVFKSRFWRILKTGVTIFNITYLLLEIVTYFLLGFGIIRTDIRFYFKGIQATDKRLASYDTISGYRGIPGSVRYLSIENGKIEIDHNVKLNNKGWFSKRDYSYKKSNSSIKRYMILGDSYSSGIAVPTAWPDLVQDLLNKNGGDSIELYNFSLDGAGIVNWYRIFKYEILPKYDFDGIIIAASSEKNSLPDFDRKFIMANSYADGNYITVMDVLAHPVPQDFPKQSAYPVSPIYPSPQLDRIKNTYARNGYTPLKYHAQNPDLWFLAIFYGVTDGFHKMRLFMTESGLYNKNYEGYYNLAGKPYKMNYFDQRYKYSFMLKEIIATCKQHNKDVILIGIPDYENAMDYVHKRDVICRQERQFLADFYQLKQFDGFGIFEGKDSAFVEKVFYEYDKHWNETGEKLFVRQLLDSKVIGSK